MIQVHGIGNHRRRRIRNGGGSRKHCDRIGNAEAEAPPAAPAGGDPAHGALGRDLGPAVDSRRVEVTDDAGGEMFARREVERDVAAIVDISLREPPAFDQSCQHLVSDCACDRRHGRDETGAMGPDRLGHAPRDWPREARQYAADRLAKHIQFIDERRENVGEARPGLVVGPRDFVGFSEGLDDEIDRPVVQMQAAVLQKRPLRAHGRPYPGSSGQGWSLRQPVSWSVPRALMDSSGRTESMWPPSAR
jgi:hypothetical protein